MEWNFWIDQKTTNKWWLERSIQLQQVSCKIWRKEKGKQQNFKPKWEEKWALAVLFRKNWKYLVVQKSKILMTAILRYQTKKTAKVTRVPLVLHKTEISIQRFAKQMSGIGMRVWSRMLLEGSWTFVTRKCSDLEHLHWNTVADALFLCNYWLLFVSLIFLLEILRSYSLNRLT